MAIFSECELDDFQNKIEWLVGEFIFQNVSPSFVHGYLCSFRGLIVSSSDKVDLTNAGQANEHIFVTHFDSGVDNFHSMDMPTLTRFLDDLLALSKNLIAEPDESDSEGKLSSALREIEHLKRENKALKEENDSLRGVIPA